MKLLKCLAATALTAAGIAQTAPINQRLGINSLVFRHDNAFKPELASVLIAGRSLDENLNFTLLRRQTSGGATGGAGNSNLSFGGGNVQDTVNRFTPNFVKQDINNKVQGYQDQYQAQKEKVVAFFDNPFKWGYQKVKAFFDPLLHPFRTAKEKVNNAQQDVQNQYNSVKNQVSQAANTVAHPGQAFNNAVDQKVQQYNNQVNQAVQDYNGFKNGVVDYKNQVEGKGGSSSA